MITIVEPDAATANGLAATLAHGGLPEPTVVATVADLDPRFERGGPAGVLVVGPGVALGVATEVAAHRRLLHPGNSVVLVRPVVDQSVLAEALRSGMSDVVAVGDHPALLDAALRSVQQAHAFTRGFGDETDASGGSRAPALQVTVFSTKGGVGKSLVAVNLAATLADAGRRTCVVDLDVQAGDVALMLQLTPQHTLADLELIHGTVDEAAVRSLITPHSENLDVLAAPVRLDAQVRADSVAAVLDVLESMYDVVVVDTSGSFDDYAVHALDRCDQLVLVGTVDVLSLKNLKLTVGTLDLLGLPRDRWRLVLNRADDKIGLSAGDFEETLGLPPVTSIPSSREVLSSVNRGEPVVRCAPRQPAARSLAELGAMLLQDVAPATAPTSTAPGTGRRRGERRRAARAGKATS